MISCGVIGYGNIGRRHCEEIVANEHLELVCITDTKCGNELFYTGANKRDDYIDMLKYEDIDLVAVCTPNNLHAQMSIHALEAGKHVVCEKPMALTKRSCELMVSTALKYKKQLFIVKQNRHNGPIQYVKKLIENGDLGTIYSINANCVWNRDERYYKDSSWKGTLNQDGGVLFTQFSHYIDAVLYLKDDRPEYVDANISNLGHPDIEIDDNGYVVGIFPDGTVMHLSYSTLGYSKNMESSITLICENGTIQIGGQYLNEIKYQDIDIELEFIADVSSDKPNVYKEGYQGTAANHKDVYNNVANTLINNDRIDVNGIDGMWTIEFIQKAYESAKHNSRYYQNDRRKL